MTRREFIGAGIALGAGLMLDGGLDIPAASASSPSGREFGVAMGDALFGLTREEIDVKLALVKKLGASLIRVDFDGYISEPDKLGEFDWTESDRIVAAAEKAGLDILGTISYMPPSDREQKYKKDYTAMPKDIQPYAHFAAAAVDHYKKALRGWEIWDQENLSPGGPDPREYARLFNGTRASVKKGNPAALVAIGGLGPSRARNGNTIPARYLDAVYNAGARKFDAIGVNAYCQPALPDQPEPWSIVTQIEGDPRLKLGHDYVVADFLAEHGLLHIPVLIPEFGASVQDPGITPQFQAETVRQIMNHKFRRVKVPLACVYTLQDIKANVATHGYGLYAEDGTPRPAAAAYKLAAAANR